MSSSLHKNPADLTGSIFGYSPLSFSQIIIFCAVMQEVLVFPLLFMYSPPRLFLPAQIRIITGPAGLVRRRDRTVPRPGMWGIEKMCSVDIYFSGFWPCLICLYTPLYHLLQGDKEWQEIDFT